MGIIVHISVYSGQLDIKEHRVSKIGSPSKNDKNV